MEPPSMTEVLARFISDLSFRDLPKQVIDAAQGRILDSLSTAIAGRDLPVPRIALDFVRHNRGKATIFAHSQKVPAVDAAFVNATLVNGRSQDDFVCKSHPGAITIPAALAIAEEGGFSGPEVLASIVIGYDIVGRIYLGGTAMLPKFRASGVAGTFGAAAAAGKLLGLDEGQLINALGCAAVFSSGFGQGFLSGTMEVKLNVGMASRNGVSAALLAQKGATASAWALEGESGFYRAFAGTHGDVRAVTADLGKRFLMEDVVYKECPTCIFVQTPIYLAATIAQQEDLKAYEIVKVIETVPQSTLDNPGFRNGGPFTTHLQAAVSARFCTAAALLRKPVAAYEFYDHYNNPEVLALGEKIDLVGEKGGDRVSLEVFLRDGRVYRLEGSEMETLAPTREKVIAKFERLASEFLGAKRTTKVIDLVLNLDRVEKIRVLTDELLGGKDGTSSKQSRSPRNLKRPSKREAGKGVNRRLPKGS